MHNNNSLFNCCRNWFPTPQSPPIANVAKDKISPNNVLKNVTILLNSKDNISTKIHPTLSIFRTPNLNQSNQSLNRPQFQKFLISQEFNPTRLHGPSQIHNAIGSPKYDDVKFSRKFNAKTPILFWIPKTLSVQFQIWSSKLTNYLSALISIYKSSYTWLHFNKPVRIISKFQVPDLLRLTLLIPKIYTWPRLPKVGLYCSIMFLSLVFKICICTFYWKANYKFLFSVYFY